MAEKKATLLVELRDTATAGLEALRGSLGTFKEAVSGALVEMVALGAEVYKSVSAFAEQEAMQARLTLALKNTTSDATAAAARLGALGDSVAKTSGLTNTAVTSFQGLLATMGFNEAAITEMTPRIADMSRALGVDAQTAALALGKSIETGSEMPLKRLGLVLDSSAFKTRDFGAVMAEVDGKVKGAAETYGNTTAGAIDKLKAAFEDLQEKIGKVLAEALIPLAKFMTDLVEKFGKFVPIVTVLAAGLEMVGSIVGNTIAGLGSLAAVMDLVFRRDWAGAKAAAVKGMEDWSSGILAGAEKASAKISGAWDQIKGNLSGSAPAAGGKPGGAPGKPNTPGGQPMSQSEFDIRIAELQGYNQKVEQMKLQSELRQRNISETSEKAQALMRAMYHKQNLENAKSFFGALGSIQASKSEELVNMVKAANIAQAIMDTYTGADKALAQGGFWGIPLAAAVVTAGMANVATIAGVQLAEGGMALPTTGGTLATIAEAGHAEAVIPLDDPRTKQKLRDTLGGGGVTLQVGTLIADQASLEDFARKLDQVFWRLKRNNQTVAI